MSNLRKRVIADNFRELIMSTKDEFTVASLLSTIMRRKNFNGKDPYFASDEEISGVLENMLTELKEDN